MHRTCILAVALALIACNGGGDDVSDDISDDTDTGDTGEVIEPLRGLVTINEVFIGTGSQPDWVELFSLSDTEIDLAGVTVEAEGAQVTTSFALDQLLGPGAFALVETPEPAAGECPQTLTVPDDSAFLRLMGPSGGIIDQVALPESRPGLSLGSYPDGEQPFIQQAASSPGEPNVGGLVYDPCLDPPSGFDDHTRPCIGSIESYHWMAGSRAGTSAVKFVITPFDDSTNLPIRFMDTVFYKLHDEFYIFNMLNGQAIPEEDVYAPYPGNFDSIEAIYDWAHAQTVLPYDSTFLRWAGDRLYSPRFYQMALYLQPRLLGAGTLIHVPARDGREAVWAFELEYSDDPAHADLVHYFASLEAGLTADIYDELHWVVRSPAQEVLAQEMEAQSLAFSDRILRYSELAEPGQIEVYNPGITAGRVRVVRAGGDGLESAGSNDILVLEEIPDYLPPCAALITAVPQTELAHINLLAKSRGIPNLSIGDVVNDPAWDQLGRIRGAVAIRVEEPDQITVSSLTSSEYSTWISLQTGGWYALPDTDLSTSPYTLDLEQEGADQMEPLRLLIGGKSAGMLPLIETLPDDPTTPDRPLSITGRAYREHMESLRADFLDELLFTTQFLSDGYPRERYLVLEGEEDYDERYPSESAQAYKAAFLAARPTGDLMGDLVRTGGVKAVIRAKPIALGTMSTLDTALRAQFGHFSGEQGLRFRSSSNVEDIQGFNGAGLYNSTTGFLDAGSLADPDDHHRTAERAIKKTWASYWSAEAYEERLAADIDHLSGDMGVLVHARFDDPQELSNGVFTMTRFPEEEPTEGLFPAPYELVINAQEGDLSVTNPPPGVCVLPEVIRVRGDGIGTPSIERLQQATDASGPVISDGDALELFDEALAVVDLWLSLENQDLPDSQASRTLTLDFEFRDMAPDWPDLASGSMPSRLIVKQARTLDPSVNALPAEVVAEPVPRDILSRARSVTLRSCEADRLRIEALEVLTSREASPDLGFADVPFTGRVTVRALADVSELGLLAGDEVEADHLDLDLTHLPPPGSYMVNAVGTGSLEVLDFEEEVSFRVTVDGSTVRGVGGACTEQTLFATPETYLIDLLAP